jgi:hypothetical protein
MTSFEPPRHPAGCQTLQSISTGTEHGLARASENAPSKSFAKSPLGVNNDGREPKAPLVPGLRTFGEN